MTDLALAPGNWSLLSAARDSVVIMWDLRTFAKLATFPVYEVLEGEQPPVQFARKSTASPIPSHQDPWSCSRCARESRRPWL